MLLYFIGYSNLVAILGTEGLLQNPTKDMFHRGHNCAPSSSGWAQEGSTRRSAWSTPQRTLRSFSALALELKPCIVRYELSLEEGRSRTPDIFKILTSQTGQTWNSWVMIILWMIRMFLVCQLVILIVAGGRRQCSLQLPKRGLDDREEILRATLRSQRVNGEILNDSSSSRYVTW